MDVRVLVEQAKGIRHRQWRSCTEQQAHVTDEHDDDCVVVRNCVQLPDQYSNVTLDETQSNRSSILEFVTGCTDLHVLQADQG